VFELWEYEFMRQALVAAVCTGLAAPAIGTYLVQRRLALLGDGIGHVALTGVAVGLLTGWAPLTTAVVLAAAGAVAIELLRAYGKTSGDVALALLFYGGIAGGVLLTAEAGESAATLNTYLFGSITTLSSAELRDIVILSGLVLIVAVGLSPQLFAICQDEEQSRVSGLPARVYGVLIAVLAAVTVTVSMRTVGLLLASALMVVPVATAQQVSRSFRLTFVLAMLLGVAA
jgi:zinc transport system permease protein